MSMKYFTLSSVCVLIFGLLLALSGVVDTPVYKTELATDKNELFTQPAPPYTPVADEGEIIVVNSPPEWGTAMAGENSSERDGLEKVGNSLKFRMVGICFVIGWILFSFKFLSME